MKKYIDISNFPLTKSLIENFDAIRTEFYTLSKKQLASKPNNVIVSTNQKPARGKILYSGSVQSVFTRVVKESCSEPELLAAFGSTLESRVAAQLRFKERQQITKTLEKCIEPYIDFIGSVGFNVIHPPGKINMHYGMCDTYIRIHMGLDCDPGARFIIENLPHRAWEEKKVFAFSDGDAFHGTEHTGVNPRTILLLDIKKTAFIELKEEIWP